MTLIPDLERDLVDAASRLTGTRQRLRLHARVAAAAALAAALAVAVVIGSGDSGQRSTAPGRSGGGAGGAGCAPGGEPSAADEWVRGDRRPVRAMTVLGCGQLWDGRPFELVARRFRRGGLCLDVYVPEQRAALECAAGGSTSGRLIAVTAYAPSGSALAERLRAGALVVGRVSAPVADVQLRFRSQGVDRHRRVPLVRVRDKGLLSAAARRRPFGVFAFVPPERIRAARLAAFLDDGRQLGGARLPRGVLVGR